MAYRVIHYINQFFGGIGGEEKADVTPEVRDGVVGPGMALAKGLAVFQPQWERRRLRVPRPYIHGWICLW